MCQSARDGPVRWPRLLCCVFVVSLLFASALPTASAEPAPATRPQALPVPPAPATGETQTHFFMQIVRNIFNMRALMDILGRPEYVVAAFLVLNLIVFVETGLLIGFFLPGDSLLVTAGVVCFASNWPLGLLLLTLCASAIIGDSVGYSIGFKAGPKIFNREGSRLFRRDHLLVAQSFYERHGAFTIVVARFMPIIRTFAPVVAGAGQMNYRKFLIYNIAGGTGWVVSMVLIGYYLTSAIDPAFRRILGNSQFSVRDHIEKVIVLVVLLSISPAIYAWLRSKLRRHPA